LVWYALFTSCSEAIKLLSIMAQPEVKLGITHDEAVAKADRVFDQYATVAPGDIVAAATPVASSPSSTEGGEGGVAVADVSVSVAPAPPKSLDMEGLKKALTEFDLKREDDATNVMKKFDVDKNGRINKKEWNTMISTGHKYAEQRLGEEMIKLANDIACYTKVGCLCCLCTLCLSWLPMRCCLPRQLMKLANDAQHFFTDGIRKAYV